MTEVASGAGTRAVSKMPPNEVELELEQYRPEITAYCYRMLASSFEAEDAVQETLIRAWRSFEGFEGRSAVRSWLYRIATNVCLDMLNGRERRARPMDLGPSRAPDGPLGGTLPEVTWIEPIPDSRIAPATADPADLAVSKESIGLAFVAALQYLPPKQRAVLILREVLRWKATEVAQLLETTVVSVNSALQRARSTLAEASIEARAPEPMDAGKRALLARYVDAFERYDMDSLTSLLHEDATQSMPPFELWLTGRDDIFTFWLGHGAACRGSHLIAVESANGSPAFGQYKPSGPNGELEPWALQVLEIVDGKIVELSFFLDTERMFPLFGLPLRLEESAGNG